MQRRREQAVAGRVGEIQRHGTFELSHSGLYRCIHETLSERYLIQANTAVYSSIALRFAGGPFLWPVPTMVCALPAAIRTKRKAPV